MSEKELWTMKVKINGVDVTKELNDCKAKLKENEAKLCEVEKKCADLMADFESLDRARLVALMERDAALQQLSAYTRKGDPSQ